MHLWGAGARGTVAIAITSPLTIPADWTRAAARRAPPRTRAAVTRAQPRLRAPGPPPRRVDHAEARLAAEPSAGRRSDVRPRAPVIQNCSGRGVGRPNSERGIRHWGQVCECCATHCSTQMGCEPMLRAETKTPDSNLPNRRALPSSLPACLSSCLPPAPPALSHLPYPPPTQHPLANCI